MGTADAAQDLLQQLCTDLRLLRAEAGGPGLRELGEQLAVGKSQIGAILNGRIRRLPDWRVVRGLADSFVRYARENLRDAQLSLPTGVDEFWRHQYLLVEHAFEQTVRGQVRASVWSPSVRMVPRQLPAAPRHFVGRADEMARLTAMIDDHGDSRRGVPVAAISGPVGVGKTTLAVHWAHRVASLFPDGQIFLDLHGHGDNPIAPADALRELLDGLGVPPDRVPTGLGARSARYRSVLAGQRVLVVLDNARDAAQVRPLLPGSAGSFLLITSRDWLEGLVVTDGAQPLALDVFTADQSRQMLVGRLGADRTSAEPAAVDQIVIDCARLPLALAIVAARAAIQPTRSLTALAGELRRVRTDLDSVG